jgi:hypothetical protein
VKLPAQSSKAPPYCCGTDESVRFIYSERLPVSCACSGLFQGTLLKRESYSRSPNMVKLSYYTCRNGKTVPCWFQLWVYYVTEGPPLARFVVSERRLESSRVWAMRQDLAVRRVSMSRVGHLVPMWQPLLDRVRDLAVRQLRLDVRGARARSAQRAPRPLRPSVHQRVRQRLPTVRASVRGLRPHVQAARRVVAVAAAGGSRRRCRGVRISQLLQRTASRVKRLASARRCPLLCGSYYWLPNRAQMSKSACQIGSAVSY